MRIPGKEKFQCKLLTKNINYTLVSLQAPKIPAICSPWNNDTSKLTKDRSQNAFFEEHFITLKKKIIKKGNLWNKTCFDRLPRTITLWNGLILYSPKSVGSMVTLMLSLGLCTGKSFTLKVWDSGSFHLYRISSWDITSCKAKHALQTADNHSNYPHALYLAIRRKNENIDTWCKLNISIYVRMQQVTTLTHDVNWTFPYMSVCNKWPSLLITKTTDRTIKIWFLRDICSKRFAVPDICAAQTQSQTDYHPIFVWNIKAKIKKAA
jgi:hypothetical protein